MKINKTKNLAIVLAGLISSNSSVFAKDINLDKVETSQLLSTQFDTRNVVKIEAGDFHFIPGQVAPIHTHAAPAIGYVAKGSIIYQVEGGKPVLLNAGDAFYEPVGPRILRFDNASAEDEAIFIDINLQQQDEPFIVFEKPLTEKIDRRTLPTTNIRKQKISKVDTYISTLEPSAKETLNAKSPIIGYVAEGVVKFKTKNNLSKRLIAGQTFNLSSENLSAIIENASKEVPAKIITFYLN